MAFTPIMVVVALIPTVTMLTGSAATWARKPSKEMEARLQRLSAGLMLGAVIVGIFPLLGLRLGLITFSGEVEVSASDAVSALVGFVLAVLLMFALKSLELDEGEDEEEERGAVQDKQQADLESQIADKATVDVASQEQEKTADLADGESCGRSPGTVSRSTAAPSSADSTPPVDPVDVVVVPVSDNDVREVALPSALPVMPTSPTKEEVPSQGHQKRHFPWGFIFAVIVDASVDGMLIGLAGGINPATGWLLAIAAALEMGFLGYTYGQTIFKVAHSFTAGLIVVLAPVFLFCVTLAAAAGSSGLEESVVFSGIMSFAMVALIFLALEELLPEASEVEGGDRWHISGWLYLGILASIVLETVL